MSSYKSDTFYSVKVEIVKFPKCQNIMNDNIWYQKHFLWQITTIIMNTCKAVRKLWCALSKKISDIKFEVNYHNHLWCMAFGAIEKSPCLICIIYYMIISMRTHSVPLSVSKNYVYGQTIQKWIILLMDEANHEG